VLERIPRYLERPNVLGIGEIGTNRNTRNELATFRDHVELALEHDLLIHIHTPHLEDKLKGTKLIVEALLEYDELDPGRVLIDHAEEHTLGMILSNGFWTGLTLYPQTKVSPERAIDMIETHGPERICVASGKRLRALDEPLEEGRVANQRHLHRLRHPGSPVALLKRLQEPQIIQDREGRCEGAHEVLLTECVDPVRDPHSRVVLREHGWGNTDQTHPSVRNRRGIADRVQ
jgi:hypothetical protein